MNVVDSNPASPAPSAPDSDGPPSGHHKVLPNSEIEKGDCLDVETGLGLTHD